MFQNTRRWGLLAGGMAAGVACVVGFAGTTASAEPGLPQPPLPAPATVTQTVTVQAGMPQAPGQLAAAPAAGAPQPAGLNVAAPAVPVPAPETIVPASSVTIVDFLKSKNVDAGAAEGRRLQGAQHRASDACRLDAGARPERARRLRRHRRPRRAGDGLYTSNAALVVYKLHGDFDPKEAISHGLIDSQQEAAWRATDGSLGDFGGMPSSIIEGTYRQNNLTLNSSRRHVLATVGPGQVPGDAVGDHQRHGLGRRGRRHRRHRQRVQGQRARGCASRTPCAGAPAAPPAAATGAAPLNQVVGTPR